MEFKRRENHSPKKFFVSTLSAQIHLWGALALLLGALPLLNLAERMGSLHYWANFSFIVTGVILFLVSSTYHFLVDGFEGCDELHDFFENLDHFCIYLFIAGTYTPFLINGVSVEWRIPLVIGIWSIAVLGILYTLFKPRLPKILQHRIVYTGIFLVMGWMMLVRATDIYANVNGMSFKFMILGCIFYSTGAVVYALKRPVLKPGVFGYHELWHLLVFAGAASHYGMIYNFYLQQ